MPSSYNPVLLSVSYCHIQNNETRLYYQPTNLRFYSFNTAPMGLNPMPPMAPMSQGPDLLGGGGLLSPINPGQPVMQINNEMPAQPLMSGTSIMLYMSIYKTVQI
jgi:hypothetical protein